MPKLNRIHPSASLKSRNSGALSTIVAIATVVILAGAALVIFGMRAPEQAAPVGQLQTSVPAPAVQFKLIDGRVLDLAAQRGKVVMIDFWATSCAICIAEMPALQQLDNDLSPRGLISVAVAMPYDRPDHVLHFVRTRGLKLDVALDIEGSLVRSLGPVRGTPTRLIVNRDGLIVARLEGALREGQLRAALEAALTENRDS